MTADICRENLPAPVLTNAEAVALAVAKLAIDGLIPVRQVASAARSVSITSNAVLTAIQHVNRNGYRPPSNRLPAPAALPPTPPPTPPPEPDPEPQPEPQPDPATGLSGAEEAEQRKPDTFPDGTRTRRCGRCGETKPIDQYRYVNKGRKKTGGARTFAWQSWCTTCWATYQQERYLSAAREATLASIGLQLNGNRLLCVLCGQPIQRGQAATSTRLHCHVACLEEPMAEWRAERTHQAAIRPSPHVTSGPVE